jgi:hypothetical protein
METTFRDGSNDHVKDIEKDELAMASPEHVEANSTHVDWTAEEEAKMVRKVDMFLMPTMWIMYLLSYMDRTK